MHLWRCAAVHLQMECVSVFICLPQDGGDRMAAVKRVEVRRGQAGGCVMDSDSQQARGPAQPQTLDSSPGETGEMPNQEIHTHTHTHSSKWTGNRSKHTVKSHGEQ